MKIASSLPEQHHESPNPVSHDQAQEDRPKADECSVQVDMSSSSLMHISRRDTSCFTHGIAVLYKKFRYAQRDFRTLALGTMIPVFSVVLGLIFYIKFTDLDQPALSMSACKLADSVDILHTGAPWDSYQLDRCAVYPDKLTSTTPLVSTFDSCLPGNVSDPPGTDFDLPSSALFGTVFGSLDSADEVRSALIVT